MTLWHDDLGTTTRVATAHENRVGERVYAMGLVGAVDKLEGACGRTCGASLWGKPGLGQGRRRKKKEKRKEKKAYCTVPLWSSSGAVVWARASVRSTCEGERTVLPATDQPELVSLDGEQQDFIIPKLQLISRCWRTHQACMYVPECG